MNVDKLSLAKIFDPTVRLEAPLFQRPYVWIREQNWQPLWESVRAVADKRVASASVRAHFLGTIVLDQITTPTGTVNTRQIIDGQQRLTTLQILLAVTRDLCNVAGAERYQKAFAKLTDNDTPLSDDPDDIFKVWPTNADQKLFRAVMKASSPAAVKDLLDEEDASGALLPEAYLFFSEVVGQWLGLPQHPDFPKRVTALYQAMKDDLNIVVIDLDAHDDAQLIFETLNALGTPLLPADLVKNFLFHRAQAEGQSIGKLYKQHWETFDKNKSRWRKEIRQGRLQRPVIDIFLQHYLTLMTGQEVLSTQLFSTFRDFVLEETNVSAASQLGRFREYGDIYMSMESDPSGLREQQFFYRLDQLDIATSDPLLLEVFHRHKVNPDLQNLHQVMQDLESFFVRRAVCELTTKSYSRFVADMIRKLRAGGDFSAGSIRQILVEQTAEATRWPDDEEFSHAWMTLPFYRRLKRSKARMILEALNAALFTDKSEKIKLLDKLTIEHLMPQEWEKHWPLSEAASQDADEQRDEAIQLAGNLTLLTKKLNPSVSNGPWEKKRGEIFKHSKLNLNVSLQDHDIWNEHTIKGRTKNFSTSQFGCGRIRVRDLIH